MFITLFIKFIHSLFGHTACGTLVPWPGIKPTPPEVEVRSLNHWTSREVQEKFLKCLQWTVHNLFAMTEKEENSVIVTNLAVLTWRRLHARPTNPTPNSTQTGPLTRSGGSFGCHGGEVVLLALVERGQVLQCPEQPPQHRTVWPTCHKLRNPELNNAVRNIRWLLSNTGLSLSARNLPSNCFLRTEIIFRCLCREITANPFNRFSLGCLFSAQLSNYQAPQSKKSSG